MFKVTNWTASIKMSLAFHISEIILSLALYNPRCGTLNFNDMVCEIIKCVHF